jgi:hypothetical protein
MKATGTAPVIDVTMNYTEDKAGNIVVDVPAYTDCQRGCAVNFALAATADANDFEVAFKRGGKDPFEPNGKINKTNPKTGKCNGGDGKYAYNVTITTKRGTTVTVDPVIIVQGP